MRVLYGMYPADGGTILGPRAGGEDRVAARRDRAGHRHGPPALRAGRPVHRHREHHPGQRGRGRPGHRRRPSSGSRSSRTRTGSTCEPDAVVEDLSVGEEQRVEILKALYRGVEILILDEPTAVLTPVETQDLFGNLRKLREAGQDDRVHQPQARRGHADRRPDHGPAARRGGRRDDARRDHEGEARRDDGRPAGPVPAGEAARSRSANRSCTSTALEGSGKLHGLSFEVRAGEILGVAGVEGNGQRELAEALIGLRTPDAGDDPAGRDLDRRVVGQGRPQRRRGLHPRGPPRAGARPRHDAVGERRPRTPRRPGVLERASACCSSGRSRSSPRGS